MAGGQQPLGEVRPDEAGAAGDECLHARTSRLSMCRTALTTVCDDHCPPGRGGAAATAVRARPWRPPDTRGRDTPQKPVVRAVASGNESVFRSPQRSSLPAAPLDLAFARGTDGRRGRGRVRRSAVVRREATTVRERQFAAPARPLVAGAASRARRIAACSFVEPAVDAGFDVHDSGRSVLHCAAADPFGDGAVVRDDGAAVAKRAEILRRVEAERAADAERADRRTHATSPDAPDSSLR